MKRDDRKLDLLSRGFVLGAAVSVAIQLSGGCSTVEVAPPLAPNDEARQGVPRYLEVPHPAGLDLADLRALLFSSSAPRRESLDGCVSDVGKLRASVVSQDELRQGVRELIRRDPVRYHWCFYTGILELDEALKAESYVDSRQKLTLEAYGFLVPVARGMLSEFRDSRYLRWATRYYQSVSEWVFFRKLQLTPEGTRELVEIEGPYGLERGREPAAASVLEKYGVAPSAPARQEEVHSIMETENADRVPAEDNPATPPTSAPAADEAPGPALGGEPPLPESDR